MTFDPLGDFETRGYLRNLAHEKDPAILRRLDGGRGETDTVRGSNDDPAIQAEYKQQLKRDEQSKSA